MERNKIIFVKEYSCNIQELWDAVTKPAELEKWMNRVDGYELMRGNKFTFLSNGELLKCQVKEVFLYHKLSFSMKFPNTTKGSTVTFLFNAMNNPKYSQLTLRHKKIDALPQNNELFSKENLELEWKEILEIDLAAFINQKFK